MTTGASFVPSSASGSPSAWAKRLPVLALALVGCGIATYLAAYQWGLLASVWDPLFGRGSARILDSWLSRRLPVPDAALGALAYLAEAISGAIGDARRWRSRPWIVIVFGLLVAGLALASVFLVLAQAFLFQTGCTLCLLSAAISFTNAWLARDEIAATLSYLGRVRARRGALWQALRGREPEPAGGARSSNHRREPV